MLTDHLGNKIKVGSLLKWIHATDSGIYTVTRFCGIEFCVTHEKLNGEVRYEADNGYVCSYVEVVEHNASMIETVIENKEGWEVAARKRRDDNLRSIFT